MDSLPQDVDPVESDPVDSDPVESMRRLCGFRQDFYACVEARPDALFELTDALLCADGPVRCLAELSLVPEHRRGHGGLYDGLNAGRVEFARLRRTLAGLPLPRVRERIVLAVDVSAWFRPDAETSPDRLFCHKHGRAKGTSQLIPGWPYSVVAALAEGRTSWTMVLDAVRLGPDDDATAVTAAQLREVVERIIAAGHWHPGDAPIEIVMDSGYDVIRLAYVLSDLPVVVTGRLRSDRVMIGPIPARVPGTMGRPPRHGPVLKLAEPASWPEPDHTTTTDTTRYGTAVASGWARMHPRLTRRGAWLDHPEDQDLPLVEGTLIRLQVDHLPGDRTPKPLWLWTSRPDATASQVDQAWQAFLRRFDIEHTFRFFKQQLGWTVPRLRDPAAADRWTWLIIVAYTQLHLARGLTSDLRRPWERPTPAERLTPTRVRRGFRNLRPKLAVRAGAPKPTRPGPGRPPGRTNRHPAPRYDVGKTTKRAVSLEEHHQTATTTG
ncbi:MAG TPA: NF041680 family putative transposase [Kineosporiaceae bacterium]